MAAAGGRLDIMLLPIGKMGVDEDARAMDLMKPKIVIPIHWRYEGEDYPIPALYKRHEPRTSKSADITCPTRETLPTPANRTARTNTSKSWKSGPTTAASPLRRSRPGSPTA